MLPEKDGNSLASLLTEVTLKALLFEVREKFTPYDSTIQQMKQSFVSIQTEEKSDVPLLAQECSNNATKRDEPAARSSGTLLQELHHQVIEAQQNAYPINESENKVAEYDGGPTIEAPLSIDFDRTSVM